MNRLHEHRIGNICGQPKVIAVIVERIVKELSKRYRCTLTVSSLFSGFSMGNNLGFWSEVDIT